MTGVSSPVRVHLVGSIGLDTVEDDIRTAGAIVGPYLRRIPDGEVGGRKLWISWHIRCCGRALTCGPIHPARCGRPTSFRC